MFTSRVLQLAKSYYKSLPPGRFGGGFLPPGRFGGVLGCLLSLLLLLACTPDSSMYERGYQCYFTFNTMLHPTSILKDCLNPMASNTYCIVTQQTRNGVRHLDMQLNDGKTKEDCAITTAEETRVSCILGAGNGLIIGCSSLNEGRLFAYDRQCPNCLKEYLNKPLQWSHNGQWVTCPQCHRSYDLNNYGFVVDGDKGRQLLLYRSSYNGTYLHVGN